jgi:hypothetical protein
MIRDPGANGHVPSPMQKGTCGGERPAQGLVK